MIEITRPKSDRIWGTIDRGIPVQSDVTFMDWRNRLTSDPDICHGRLCVRGTRVMVSVILDNLAAGESFEAISRGYDVEREDIEACLHYASELARDRVLALVPGVA